MGEKMSKLEAESVLKSMGLITDSHDNKIQTDNLIKRVLKFAQQRI